MAPRPYSERVSEPIDLTPLSQEVPDFPGHGVEDTPSPRTPSSMGSPTPSVLTLATEQRPFAPILYREEGVPYDHTLPDFVRQVTGQPTLTDIHSMTLRVLTEASSLQQMSFYAPNLRELNLEGSALTSLRDLGSELSHLHILRVNRCHLVSLDGTIALGNLRQLYAAGNSISSAGPCSHLTHLRFLDISKNHIQDVRSLSFLSRCKNLRSLCVSGNPIRNHAMLQSFVETTLPFLEFLDESAITLQDRNGADNRGETGTTSSPTIFELEGSTSTSDSSRISSASSSNSSNAKYCEDPTAAASSSQGYDGVHRSTSDTDIKLSEGSVSSLTSGQIVCGNLVNIRRRQQPRIIAERPPSATLNTDALEASMRWRMAYRRFRELNSQRWEEESKEDDQQAATQDEEPI